MLKAILIVLALFAASPSWAEATVHDYITPFVEGYEQLSDKSPPSVKAYILGYEFRLGQEFNEVYYKYFDEAQRQQLLLGLDGYVANMPALATQYPKRLVDVRRIVEETETRFQDLFQAELTFPLYCWSSLAWTDGKITQLGGVEGFSLNFRQIAFYPEAALKVVLAHELFHVLQAQLQTSSEGLSKVEAILWAEGWATYASSLVFPGLPDWKYFTYYAQDDAEYQSVQRQKADIIRSLLADLESDDDAALRRYFYGSSDDSAPFPQRSGYLIGYELAMLLAKSEDPISVAKIDAARFKQVVRPLLNELLAGLERH